jgi:hypothetical protein
MIGRKFRPIICIPYQLFRVDSPFSSMKLSMYNQYMRINLLNISKTAGIIRCKKKNQDTKGGSVPKCSFT